jgi:hypothetical protein
MYNPGSYSKLIHDLVPSVIEALQNRQDVTTQQAANWLVHTLKELTPKYPFEELRIIGPNVIIGPGLGFGGSANIFPVKYFLNTGEDYSRLEDPVIYFAGGNTSSSTLQTLVSGPTYPMDYMQPKAIQPLMNVPGGIPFKYTRYGGMFWFGAQPTRNFAVFCPYQKKHPFTDGNVMESPLYIASEWEQIVAYDAARRGATALRWNEQADYLHTLIYGDPDNPSKRPGLIAALDNQQERDQRLSTRSVTMRVERA